MAATTMPEQDPDPIGTWMKGHPWTLSYIAFMVTVLFLMEVF